MARPTVPMYNRGVYFNASGCARCPALDWPGNHTKDAVGLPTKSERSNRQGEGCRVGELYDKQHEEPIEVAEETKESMKSRLSAMFDVLVQYPRKKYCRASNMQSMRTALHNPQTPLRHQNHPDRKNPRLCYN